MRERFTRLYAAVLRHPRLVVSLVVLIACLALTGSAAALDGGAVESLSLGNETEVGTHGGNGGPTNPQTTSS